MRSQGSVLKEILALHTAFKLDVAKVLDQPDVSPQEVGLALMSISALTLIEMCESALGHEGMQGGTPEDILDLAITTVTSLSKLKRHQLKQTA